MPAKEIKALRQAGKLTEAYELAKAEWDQARDNIWSKRNISWVYMDMAKEKLGAAEFERILDELIALNMPEGEKMFYEQLAWNLGKHISSLLKQQNVKESLNAIYDVFKKIKGLPFESSKGLSYLLQILHKSFKEQSKDGVGNITFDTSLAYVELMEWWDWEYFSVEDYEVQSYNGKRIMSLVEQITIAYSKVLLHEDQKEGTTDEDHLDSLKGVNVDGIESFLPFLNKVVENHPEYHYPIYFKVQLLQAVGRTEEAREAVLPFVKKKQRDFWTWDLMGDLYPAGSDEQIGCYCKALSLPGDQKFRIKIHEKLGRILRQKEMLPEAKYEYLQVIQIRDNNRWKLTKELEAIVQTDWYQNSTATNEQ